MTRPKQNLYDVWILVARNRKKYRAQGFVGIQTSQLNSIQLISGLIKTIAWMAKRYTNIKVETT